MRSDVQEEKSHQRKYHISVRVVEEDVNVQILPLV